jgi:hypothetical protein
MIIVSVFDEYRCAVSTESITLLEAIKDRVDGKKVRGQNVIIMPNKSLPKLRDFSAEPTAFSKGTEEMLRSVAYNCQKRESTIEKIKASYPNDIRFDYEYKGVYPEVLAHQKIIYNMIAYPDVSSIISEPGTCKTGPYLWAIDTRIQRGQVRKALVITLSQLKENVLAELEIQAPHLRGVVLKTSTQATNVLNKTYKRAFKNKDYDIYIANYESMFSIVDMVPPDYFDMVILDECHRVGSHQSRQTKSIVRYCEGIKYKSILTGTLHANNEMSFFMPFRFLGPDVLPTASYMGFRSTWMYPVDPDRRIWKPNGGMEYEVAKIVGKISVMFKKEECLDLPPLVTETIRADMEGDQKAFYAKFKKDLVAKIDDMCNKCSKKDKCDGLCEDEMEAKNSLVLSGKLLQIASGIYINTRYEVSESGSERNVSPIIYFESNPKMALLKQVLMNIPSDRKVIIWSQYVAVIQLIERELGKAFGSDRVMTCYGDQDAFQQVNTFRDDPSKIWMVANPSKMGVGLNIQFSSYMVFFSSDYSYVKYDQAVGRQHRQGQTDSVTVFNLAMRHSMDEVVYRSIAHKKDLNLSLSQLARIMKDGVDSYQVE